MYVCVYNNNLLWMWTYSTYRTLATHLPTFLRWTKKNEKKQKKNIEVINTYGKSRLYAKFFFSQYQIIDDDTTKS